ncbi:LamG domain-containing protein [Tenacibaculum sp.]|uniref:LamG domain-containing protein n=1 Tax=Tenacibaculum sp. TaxID=1906242 RepID=UPI003AA933FB
MKKIYTVLVCVSVLIGACSKDEENLPVKEVTPFENLLKDNNLMAYYPFNGSANDNKNSYDGIVKDFDATQDRKGNNSSAYKSTTASAEISFPAAIPFKNESFSMSFWFKVPTNLHDAVFTILSKREACKKGDFIQVAYKKGSNELTVEMRSDNVMTDLNGSATADLENVNPTEWTHVVIIKDNSTRKTTIYVNGEEKVSTPWSLPNGIVSIDNTAKFKVGHSPCAISGLNNFIGSIDELILLKKALTPQEISILKNQ